MRSGLIGILALSGLAMCATSANTQPKGGKGGKASEGDAVRNGWLFSLAEGKTQARKSGKPMMVVVRCVP
jgi:hypothetical protein